MAKGIKYYRLRKVKRQGKRDGRDWQWKPWRPFPGWPLWETKEPDPPVAQKEPSQYESKLISIAHENLERIANDWAKEDEKLTEEYCNAKDKKEALESKIAKEYEGFELLINTPGVFIGKTRRGITLKERGIKKLEAPLLNLKNISILSRGVTISSNVVEYCAEKGIPIDFVGFNGKPYAKVYPLQSSLASLGIAQLKAFENGKASALAKCFTSGKIRNQINLAKYYYKYRKGRDEDFTAIFDEKVTSMESFVKEVRTLH